MNIYEQIKNNVTNKEVAIHYLGQPVKSSTNYLLYSSPFRKDKNPSFAVNDKGFIDFGDKEYCGDMIQFVKQLKGCQYPHEAAKIIIKDMGLNIEIPENIKNVKEKKSKKKISELCFEKGNKTNNIICMFDSQKYSSKPAKEQIGYIKNRISKLRMQEYRLEEIQDNIISGMTIIPSGIKGNAQENWKKQQIFLVDFDNTYKGEKLYKENPRHVTVEKILNYCRRINFEPTFIYTTFSNSEKQNKFRLAYVFEEPITEYLLASQIPQKLLEIFKDFYPDTSKQNLSDMFFGGKEIVYTSGNYYKVSKNELEIEQIEYQEIKESDKPSHDIIARKLLQENEIRVFEDTLYIYENGVYRRNEKSINRKIIEIYPKATTRMQKEVKSYLLTMAPEVQLKYENLINFKNGLYDLNNNTLMPHSPYYFTINQINANINWDPVRIGAVDRFLDKISCGNIGRKKAILQMIGYSMTSSVEMQKAFVLYGKTAGNGKSTLLEIIEKLIGSENVSHVTLQDFVSNRFSVSEIKGKLVNMVSEMTKEFLKDSSVFKQIVTGDTTTVEEKFKDRHTIKPYAKHIFTANELPKVADTSNGYFRRLFIIPFEAVFTDLEKINFNFKELITEQALDYLAAIALQEYIIARREHAFINEEESKNIIETYKMDSNTVIAYLYDKDRMRCLLRSGRVRKRNEVFADYINYCKDSGYIHKGRNKFYEEVESTGLVQKGVYNGYDTYIFDKTLIK
ncbi:MAG: phage/plasmid primase, P4 family [Clostridia bacterium]